jgi:hypothetical protein
VTSPTDRPPVCEYVEGVPGDNGTHLVRCPRAAMCGISVNGLILLRVCTQHLAVLRAQLAYYVDDTTVTRL